MLDNQYPDTNAVLLDTLKRGILKEQNEIAELAREAQKLKEETSSKNATIVNEKLNARKEVIISRIDALNERAKQISKLRVQKSALINSYIQGIKSIEEEISEVGDKKGFFEDKLNESLKKIASESKKHVHVLNEYNKNLFKEIHGIKRDEESLSRKVEESKKLAARKLEEECALRENQIKESQRELLESLKDKQKGISDLFASLKIESEKNSLIEDKIRELPEMISRRVHEFRKQLAVKKSERFKSIEKNIDELRLKEEKARKEFDSYSKIIEESANQRIEDERKKIAAEMDLQIKSFENKKLEMERARKKIELELEGKKKGIVAEKEKIDADFNIIQDKRIEAIEKESKGRAADMEKKMLSLKEKIDLKFNHAEKEFENVLKSEKEDLQKLQQELKDFEMMKKVEIGKHASGLDKLRRNLIDFESKKIKISEQVSNRIKEELKIMEGKKNTILGENISAFEEEVRKLREKSTSKLELLQKQINEEGAERENLERVIAEEKLNLEKNLIEKNKLINEKKRLIEEQTNGAHGKRMHELQKERDAKIKEIDRELVLIKSRIADEEKKGKIKELNRIEAEKRAQLKKTDAELKNYYARKKEQIKENIKRLQVERNKLALMENSKNKILHEAADRIKKEVGRVEEEKKKELEKRMSRIDSEILALRENEKNISKRNENLIGELSKKLKQSAALKVQKLEAKLVSEKQRQRDEKVLLNQKNEAITKDFKNKREELELEKKNLDEVYSKLEEKEMKVIEEKGKEQLNKLQEEVSELKGRIKAIRTKAAEEEEKRKIEINDERKKFSAKKAMLLQEIAWLREKKSSSNEQIYKINESNKLLGETITELKTRAEEAKNRKEKVEEKIKERANLNLELDKVVKEKLERIQNRRKMQKELHQLYLVMHNQLKPMIKVKWRTRHQVKWKTRKKTVLKVVNRTKWKVKEKINWRTKIKVKWRTRIENRIKEKIKWKIKTRVEKLPIQNKSEMTKFLKEIDDLLGKLSKEEIDKFAKSSAFGVYKKMMQRYNIK